MIKLLEKLISEKGTRFGNLLCLGMSILIVSLPGRFHGFFKTFGVALGLMACVYIGYKLTEWKWLEMIYPLAGALTIALGIIALFK